MEQQSYTRKRERVECGFFVKAKVSTGAYIYICYNIELIYRLLQIPLPLSQI